MLATIIFGSEEVVSLLRRFANLAQALVELALVELALVKLALVKLTLVLADWRSRLVFYDRILQLRLLLLLLFSRNLWLLLFFHSRLICNTQVLLLLLLSIFSQLLFFLAVFGIISNRLIIIQSVLVYGIYGAWLLSTYRLWLECTTIFLEVWLHHASWLALIVMDWVNLTKRLLFGCGHFHWLLCLLLLCCILGIGTRSKLRNQLFSTLRYILILFIHLCVFNILLAYVTTLPSECLDL